MGIEPTIFGLWALILPTRRPTKSYKAHINQQNPRASLFPFGRFRLGFVHRNAIVGGSVEGSDPTIKPNALFAQCRHSIAAMLAECVVAPKLFPTFCAKRLRKIAATKPANTCLDLDNLSAKWTLSRISRLKSFLFNLLRIRFDE